MPDHTTTTYRFAVEGMHCASCGLLIDDALEDLDGVTTSATSLRAARTTVEVDPSRSGPDDLIAAIAAAGYTARLEHQ
jgi:copper chaperone